LDAVTGAAEMNNCESREPLLNLDDKTVTISAKKYLAVIALLEQIEKPTVVYSANQAEMAETVIHASQVHARMALVTLGHRTTNGDKTSFEHDVRESFLGFEPEPPK
jgi:hypothetical protein